MSEKKVKIDRVELLRWFVLPFLILTLLGGVIGQQMPQGFHALSTVYSIDSNQSSTFQYVHDSDLFSPYKVFGDFEFEEGDDDGRSSNIVQSQAASQPIVQKEVKAVALFPSKKLIKLFILFHSWKSFLQL
jgi:hypothetical protein